MLSVISDAIEVARRTRAFIIDKPMAPRGWQKTAQDGMSVAGEG
jgi:hypothetical protein